MRKFYLALCISYFLMSCVNSRKSQNTFDTNKEFVTETLIGKYVEVIEELENASEVSFFIIHNDDAYSVERDKRFNSGDRVGFKLKNGKISELEKLESTSSGILKPKLGEKKVLFLVPDFNDVKNSSDLNEEYLQDKVDKFSKYFNQVSRGQIRIKADFEYINIEENFTPHLVDADGKTLRGKGKHCNLWQITGQGKTLSQKATNDTYIFIIFSPDNSGSICRSAAGVASLNDQRAWIRSHNLNTYVHEFGHNLGLRHASIDSNLNGQIETNISEIYGDHSDPMGNNFRFRNEVLNFNSANAIDLGIFTPLKAQLFEPVTLSRLSNLDLIDNTTASFTPFHGLYDYTFSFRVREGLDSIIKPIYEGVAVHKKKIVFHAQYGSTGTELQNVLTSEGSEFVIDYVYKVKLINDANRFGLEASIVIEDNCDEEGLSRKLSEDYIIHSKITLKELQAYSNYCRERLR